MAAYRYEEEWVNELNDYISQNEERVKLFLKEEVPKIRCVKAQGSYLLWLDTSRVEYSMDEIQESLINEAKIAIMNGRIYRGNGEQFLRLSIGCPKSKLKEGVERLRYGIQQLK